MCFLEMLNSLNKIRIDLESPPAAQVEAPKLDRDPCHDPKRGPESEAAKHGEFTGAVNRCDLKMLCGCIQFPRFFEKNLILSISLKVSSILLISLSSFYSATFQQCIDTRASENLPIGRPERRQLRSCEPCMTFVHS